MDIWRRLGLVKMEYKTYAQLPLKEYLEQFREANQDKKVRAKYGFSYWSSDMFKQCPRKYKGIVLEHKRGVEVDQRTSIEGTVLHSVMENFLLRGLPEWDWPSANADKVFDAMTAAAAKLVWKKSDPEGDKAGARQLVRDMVAYAADYLHQKNVFERYEVHPEYPFRAMVLPDMTISGRTDLWLQDKQTGQSEIVDWKGIKDPARAKSEQMLFYGLGIMALGGGFVSRCEFCCPQIQFIKTLNFSEDMYKNFLQGIESLKDRVAHSIEKQCFPKITSGLCKYCALQDTCEEESMGTVTETFEGGVRTISFE